MVLPKIDRERKINDAVMVLYMEELLTDRDINKLRKRYWKKQDKESKRKEKDV